MNRSFLEQEPKLMMSESLEDSMASDDVASLYDTMFISIALIPSEQSNALMGSLVGIELTKQLKIDLKVSLDTTFNFFKNILKEESTRRLQSVALSFSNQITVIDGPFGIVNAKIIEINPASKSCVVAVDLIKNNE